MKTTEIIKLINDQLSGELLSWNEAKVYADSTIDDINEALSSIFPTFTQAETYPGYTSNYDYFPDNYIRSVVVVGSAYKFYLAEEEGEPIAHDLKQQYASALFIMKRDYLAYVPTIFQANAGGVLDMDWPWTTEESGDLGLTTPLNPQYIPGPVGPPGPRGPRGLTGLTGPRGPIGPQGDQGIQGIQGEQGEQGIQGEPFEYTDFTPEQLVGLIGPQGPIGPQGEPGENFSGLAEDMNISDLDNYYTSTNVEGALQEIGAIMLYLTDDEVTIPSSVYLAQDSDFAWWPHVDGDYNPTRDATGYFEYIGTETEVEIPSVIEGTNITWCTDMFDDSNVTKVVLNNPNITSMRFMFYNNSATTLDVTSFNTSNVTTMASMFRGCQATELDLSSFDLSSVEVVDMWSMFQDCAATTVYCRTQADLNKMASTDYIPAGMSFVLKEV